MTVTTHNSAFAALTAALVLCRCVALGSSQGCPEDPAVVCERSFDVSSGDEWRMDWSWREVDVPLTALLRPRVMALDADAKIVFLRYVGQVQQRTFGPEDMSVQRWRVYASVSGGSGSAE